MSVTQDTASPLTENTSLSQETQLDKSCRPQRDLPQESEEPGVRKGLPEPLWEEAPRLHPPLQAASPHVVKPAGAHRYSLGIAHDGSGE